MAFFQITDKEKIKEIMDYWKEQVAEFLLAFSSLIEKKVNLRGEKIGDLFKKINNDPSLKEEQIMLYNLIESQKDGSKVYHTYLAILAKDLDGLGIIY